MESKSTETVPMDEAEKARKEQEKLDNFAMKSWLKFSTIRQAILIDMVPMPPRQVIQPKKTKSKFSAGGPIKKSTSMDSSKTQLEKISECCRSMNKKQPKKPTPFMAQCIRSARYSVGEVEKRNQEMRKCQMETRL